MEAEIVKATFVAAKVLQRELNEIWLPPVECSPISSEKVLPKSLVARTRGYIEVVANQINKSYENACYDGCAVLIRRLIETLIIEAFEQNNIAANIKDREGEFLSLRELIGCLLKETSWNISRNAKVALKDIMEIKAIGDLSAHNRRYNAHRSDIDKIIPSLRVIVQELLYLAKLK